MKTVGIICEYNPFHRGHAAQMAAIRQSFGAETAVVCAMSGNFVQRGAPAVFDKYTRAAAAVACGADLVLELPVPVALSSAEGYARGGVELLDRLGVTDALCFGCECGDGAALMAAARAMEAPDFDEALRARLAAGERYAAAKQAVLAERMGADILRRPNDILGAEYCRALLRRESAIEVFAIPRGGDYHDPAPDAVNPSATSVRERLRTGDWESFVPAAAAEIFRQAPQYRMEWGERALLARLRAMTEDEWSRTAHGSEGLWSKMRTAAHEAATVEEILQAAASKRYPMARLRRLLLCAYLGITGDDLTAPMEEIRVLALSERGRTVLKKSREQGTLRLLDAGERPAAGWEPERRYADLFTLFSTPEQPPLAAMEQNSRVSLRKK